MASTQLQLNNPRQNAIRQMKASTGSAVWERNLSFIQALKEEIRQHPVAGNPAIHLLNDGVFGIEELCQIHLEYRHAIVQTFTDALLMAQFQTRQLEPRFPSGAKLAPRFLLTLNCLDEFGFRPGLDSEGYYQGNPLYAHYPLFERVLDDLGITPEQRSTYAPSAIARTVRDTLETSFGRYEDVVALLAVAEEEVILYSPPLRRASAAVGIDVDSGYYHVHGTSEDETAEAFDDDHEDDLWYVLAQALEPADYGRIRSLCLKYCDQWDEFWTLQTELAYLPRHPMPDAAYRDHRLAAQ